MSGDLTSIVKQLLRKICNSNCTKNLDSRNKFNRFLEKMSSSTFLTDNKKDLYPLEKIDVGIEVKLLLEKIIKADPSKNGKLALQFRKDVQSIIIHMLSKISVKSPLKFSLVYYSASILPSNILKFSLETTIEKFDGLITSICQSKIIPHHEGDCAKSEMEAVIIDEL